MVSPEQSQPQRLRRRLPLEIFGLIGAQLLPDEPFSTSTSTVDFVDHTEWDRSMATLRNLSYTCYDIHHELKPLFYQFIYLRNGHDIIALLVQLLQRPRFRKHVRHIYCDTVSSWLDKREGKPLWEQHYGKGMGLQARLAEAEFMWSPGDCSLAAEAEKVVLGTGMAYDMDDVLHLAFGGILLLTKNLESLSLHREITRNGFMADVKDVLAGAEHPQNVLPNLKVIKLAEEHVDESRTDSLPCFLSFLSCYGRGQKLILSGVNENLQFLLRAFAIDHHQTLPQIEELILRPWNTPAELKGRTISLDPESRPLEYLPTLFNQLRVLDVEFSQEPFQGHDIWGPLQRLSGTLEVLRLKRQQFPLDLLRGKGMKKLREVILEECSTFCERPEAWEVEGILADCTNGFYMNFEHLALERVEINGSRFEVIHGEERGPPRLRQQT